MCERHFKHTYFRTSRLPESHVKQKSMKICIKVNRGSINVNLIFKNILIWISRIFLSKMSTLHLLVISEFQRNCTCA